MEKKIILATTLLSALLVALSVAAYFSPTALTWGFHFLGFLPGYSLVLYCVAALSVFLLHFTGYLERGTVHASEYMAKRPLYFLVFTNLMFIAVAAIFRNEATLLGDSFTLIYNFRDYADGVSYLAPWHEPLSMYILYYGIRLFGSLEYPQIFTSFFIVQIIAGAGFITAIFFAVKKIFSSPRQRFLVFFWLITLPYMEFFFGYIEVYSISAFLLSIFLLVSILVMQKKLPFYVLPGTWLVLTFSHYINGFLGLALLYQAYLEYKEGTIKTILIGFGGALLIGLSVFALANFEAERLINISPISHFLSLTNAIDEFNAYSQAYTIVSPYHIIDIVNYLILMCPFTVMVFILWYSERKDKNIFNSPLGTWFILALVPLSLYYLVSKLEQGNASDWDAFAAGFMLLNLFAAIIFFRQEYASTIKMFSLIVAITFLQSLTWFSVNAPAGASIERFQSLWDKRVLSHLGNYTHALRLSRYYDSRHDSISQINVWERYSALYPGDPRGHRTIIQMLSTFTPDQYSRRITAYERWRAADPNNDSIRTALASVHVSMGNHYFASDSIREAERAYRKAISLDQHQPKAYNNLGTVYAIQGNLDSAIVLFGKAVTLDSSYGEAHYNLGNAFLDMGKTAKGMQSVGRAASLGNPQAKEMLGNKR